MNILREPLAERLAGAYVIGTLRGAARRRFECLMAAHPRLQAHVLRWQQRFSDLVPAPEKAPPAAVWARIAARLPRHTAPTRAVAHPLRRLREWLWPVWATTATVTALGLALVTWPLQSQDPLGVTVAILQPAELGTTAGVIVVTQPSAQVWQVIVPRQADPGPQRSWELWAVPFEGQPISLGVAPQGRATPVRVPPGDVAFKALAVSLEPAGGSPTGTPTGPVRYLAPWPWASATSQNPT